MTIKMMIILHHEMPQASERGGEDLGATGRIPQMVRVRRRRRPDCRVVLLSVGRVASLGGRVSAAQQFRLYSMAGVVTPVRTPVSSSNLRRHLQSETRLEQLTSQLVAS